MAGQFGASVVIDRPIDEVFAFLSEGENDTKFSPRVQEIHKTTAGPPGKGTVFVSTVKDAGMTSKREFELTEVQAPNRIRWTERSKHAVVVPEGGYDLEPADGGTRLTFFNALEGRGVGAVVVGFALRSARKDADGFAHRIKAAVESAA